MHAKQFMMDDYLLGMGSANMDKLSFFLNYEVMTLVYDENTTRHAANTFLTELEEHCEEITPEEVRSWSFFRKIRNWVVRFLAGSLT
jgi:cardiolipin synthase